MRFPNYLSNLHTLSAIFLGFKRTHALAKFRRATDRPMELHISDNKNRNQIRRSISKGFPSPTNDDFNINLPSPRVPTEIVDHILALALASCSSASLVPEFSSIAAVTLASTDFRQIALRRYFHDITLETRPHWKGLFSVLEMQEYKQAWKGKKEGGFAWVR
jgi:hypothetical protein